MGWGRPGRLYLNLTILVLQLIVSETWKESNSLVAGAAFLGITESEMWFPLQKCKTPATGKTVTRAEEGSESNMSP